jgi:hypothetical protein
MGEQEDMLVGTENTSRSLGSIRSVLTCFAVGSIALIVPLVIYSGLALIIDNLTDHNIPALGLPFAMLASLLPGTALILRVRRTPIPLKVVASIGYFLVEVALLLIYVFFFNCLALTAAYYCP